MWARIDAHPGVRSGCSWGTETEFNPLVHARGTVVTMTDELLARIDRIESTEAIRQLVARYSLALDMRDIDSLVGLFPEDIRVMRRRRTRRPDRLPSRAG